MKNYSNTASPRTEHEMNVFKMIWSRGGNCSVITADGTITTIPPSGDERDTSKWEKARNTLIKASKNGPLSIKAQLYDTGKYNFIPLFVRKEDSVKSVIELTKNFVQNNKENPDYHFIGTEVLKYQDRYAVLWHSEVRNIPSARKLINAFAEWVSKQIGEDVTTADEVPLYGGYTQTRPYNRCHLHGIRESQISAVTDVWYDSEEKPLPPMWLSEISMTKKPDASDIFASIGNTPIVQRGGITLVSGAAKSGKTLLISSIIAAVTGRNETLGITPGTQARILWCDTEQSENDLAIVRQRIEGLAGVLLKNADIKGLRLRPFGPEKSTEIIENALKQYEPDILLIDGPGDLCPDTNDISASQATVKTLLRWCDEYDCAVVGVVHTNPGSEKTRGHIGSEIERKCAFSLLTAKNDSLDSEYPTFKVKPGFMRGKQFKAYSFRYNEDGLPELVDAEETREKVNAESSIVGDLDQGFDYSFTDLLQRAKLMGIKDNTAKSAITRLLQKGKLTKSDDKYRLAEG